MSKLELVLIGVVIVLTAASCLLFYNGLKELSDYGLKNVIEEIWEGKNEK